MECGVIPENSISIHVYRRLREVERIDRLVDPKYVDIATLRGLTPLHETEVQILENASDWQTRGVDRACRRQLHQYERMDMKHWETRAIATFT